jgi:hypothetical protein
MKPYLYIIFLFFGLSLVACQEEVFLDLAQNEPLPVIEAIWTDMPGLNHVSVTYSKNYYESEGNAVVDNAEVFIINETANQRISFRYVNQTGTYLPINSHAARIGDVYSLHVRIGENEYFSTGRVLEPPTLDSIAVNFREERLFREEGYYLTLYGDIPFEEDNYYRIRVVRNDTILNRRNDYLLFDDTFGTQILNRGFELNGFAFRQNDRVRLELFRLNRDAFNYMNELVALLFNDGGLFSPPPQNPTSNISVVKGEGEVMGYFMVSPVVGALLNIAEGEE